MSDNPTHVAFSNTSGKAKNRPGFPPAGLEGGQAIAEFAIAFPLQLLIMFAIMQLALIYVGKQVTIYASYSAARSALVADSPADAYRRAHFSAALVCSPVTGPTVRGGNVSPAEFAAARMEVPGWGEIKNSGVSRRMKTHVRTITFVPDWENRREVDVTVTHYFELTLPVVSWAFDWLHRWKAPTIEDATGREGSVAVADELSFEEDTGIWNVDAPHMRLREHTRLAIPGR
ncbi:MAG: pilus assembly protein [Planctomycetes bacterium]|nr:pilus assembly protein [Planctomycetota bacterium]